MVDLDLSDSEFLFEGNRCQLFLQLDDNAVSEAFVMNQIAFSYFTLFGFKSKTLFSFPGTKFSIKGARYSISFCIPKSTMYHKPANNK